MKTVDLAVVGAGPAGMAAASEARGHGLSVAVLDEQEAPGGQIYHAVEAVAAYAPERLALLGEDYTHGRRLAESFRASGAEYIDRALVWQLEPNSIWYLRDEVCHELKAERILLANGAIERPVPIPGWTQPGVMTAGGVQILLKSSGVVPDGRVMLAGNGPLLYLLAAQLLAAGCRIGALVETVPHTRYLEAAPYLPAALGSGYLSMGLRLLRHLRSSGTRIYRNARDLRAEGEQHAEALCFRAGGREVRLDSDLIVLHEGVIPNQQLTRALGCVHRWDDRQKCFRPKTDEWGNTSVESVLTAGDGAGIGGALAAEHAGRLAALEAARSLGYLVMRERDRLSTSSRRQLNKLLRGRRFLEVLYAPPEERQSPSDETLVCRCEEVTAGQVRAAVRTGCTGPNQVKAFTRSGMGPCQGRMCGNTVAAIIAEAQGITMEECGYYRIRPPIKPIPLAALAASEVERELDDAAQ